jgi:hypothetical protein
MAEAQAVLLVAKQALLLDLNNLILEGDSSAVITTLQQPSLSSDWHIHPMISYISHLLSSISWYASKNPRSANS